MQRKGEHFYDKGPSFAMADVEEEVKKPPKKRLEDGDSVYVFCTQGVDAGDGKPIPAAKFVQVKANRIRRLQSMARQKGSYLNVMPHGWTPKELDL